MGFPDYGILRMHKHESLLDILKIKSCFCIFHFFPFLDRKIKDKERRPVTLPPTNAAE
jgi:hypothetical protein